MKQTKFNVRVALGTLATASFIASPIWADSPVYNGETNYVPLEAAPCDLSDKSIQWLGILKAHPTLRLWQQGFLDEAEGSGSKVRRSSLSMTQTGPKQQRSAMA